MLVSKRSLLINVTLDTSGVRAGGQAGLLRLETAMGIVTVTATHRAFQNFVMERHGELRLHFVMTADAELRIVCLQHTNSGKAGLLGIRRFDQHVRAGFISAVGERVRRMAIGAADVVAPVLSATEIVPLFFSRVAGQTRFRSFFWRFVFEGDDLRDIAVGNMIFAWPVAGLTPGDLTFPTA